MCDEALTGCLESATQVLLENDMTSHTASNASMGRSYTYTDCPELFRSVQKKEKERKWKRFAMSRRYRRNPGILVYELRTVTRGKSSHYTYLVNAKVHLAQDRTAGRQTIRIRICSPMEQALKSCIHGLNADQTCLTQARSG